MHQYLPELKKVILRPRVLLWGRTFGAAEEEEQAERINVHRGLDRAKFYSAQILLGL